MQALSIEASARPTTGFTINSRAPPSPGSPKAAMIAPSKLPSRSASISRTMAAPIAASARVAM
jgi:hypothetical protein